MAGHYHRADSRRRNPYKLPSSDLTPPSRRIYAHIESGGLGCPRCRTVHRFSYSRKVKRIAELGMGYDRDTGIFRCRHCHYRAYVGVVLWPIKAMVRRIGRPHDHVLTPGEAARVRLEVSYEAREAGTVRRTNVECTCGEPCAVHSTLDNADEDNAEDGGHDDGNDDDNRL